MDKELFDTYNKLKEEFVSKIEDKILKTDSLKVVFSPVIRIMFPTDSDEQFEDITEIQYDCEEDELYCHNYITDENLDVDEYWTPLIDMSFDELFKMAERL